MKSIKDMLLKMREELVRIPLLTKIIELIPQTVALRSGLLIRLRGRRDAKHFWHMFTSGEYLAFLPELVSIQEPRFRVIDCGAGIGLFSLLIEHLRRLGILRWGSVSYVAIEPSKYNLDRIKRNISSNLDDGSYEIVEGLVGQRSGESDFFQSPWQRWSASVFQRTHFLERKVRRQYVDISPYLGDVPCLLKVDIEGAEFAFFDAYQAQLSNVKALIVEWHAECGDVDHSDSVLVFLGFERVARRQTEPNRIVDLYVRRSA